MRDDSKKKSEKSNIIPQYVFDLKAGFPFVKLPDLSKEEEAELVKDAIERSNEISEY